MLLFHDSSKIRTVFGGAVTSSDLIRRRHRMKRPNLMIRFPPIWRSGFILFLLDDSRRLIRKGFERDSRFKSAESETSSFFHQVEWNLTGLNLTELKSSWFELDPNGKTSDLLASLIRLWPETGCIRPWFESNLNWFPIQSAAFIIYFEKEKKNLVFISVHLQ